MATTGHAIERPAASMQAEPVDLSKATIAENIDNPVPFLNNNSINFLISNLQVDSLQHVFLHWSSVRQTTSSRGVASNQI